MTVDARPLDYYVQALDRTLAEAELLNAVAAAANGEADLERLLAGALEHLRRVIPFTGAAIALVEGNPSVPSGQALVIQAALGPFAEQARGQRRPRARDGAAWRVVETGEPFLSDDVLAEWLEPTHSFGSYLAVPLGWRRRRFGVLEIDSTAPAAFDAADLRLMERVAATLSGSIELAARYAAEVRYAAELQSALQERDRALAEIRELERAREEFLSAASHDLRTPLTTIQALAQLGRRTAAQLDRPEAERLVGWLSTINQSSLRMSKLITELVDVVRLHAGRPLDLESGALDLVALTRRVVVEQQATTDRHRIRLEAEADELIGQWDDDRIERVLGNLISNAIKYSPEAGEVVVRVGRARRGQADRAVLTVRDQGIGIPADDLPRVFERYHRGSNAAGRFGGTGIGLASVRQIVERHGGSVGVTSQEGKGSTFTVELPLLPTIRSCARPVSTGRPRSS
ncbi:MAG TPA: GAF domain-containing sensor histidine kinase [Chloroflexota bacterium]|jgi:signal transduction histidine kinase|nr:GAF domain-containing sensor histidine kinase [Chloroflexota bacterium]